jgi:uncharacterized membrane protein YedE/YeeE
MTEFTPLTAAIGGLLIGLSSALLMLLTGRIAGISGIFGGLLTFGTPAAAGAWPLCLACWRRQSSQRLPGSP